MNTTNPPKRTIPVMYPPGLVQIFHDPRAVGLNADWVMKLLMYDAGPRPSTADEWLFLYLGMRAAELNPPLPTPADPGPEMTPKAKRRNAKPHPKFPELANVMLSAQSPFGEVIRCHRCAFHFNHTGAINVKHSDNYEAGWDGRGDLITVDMECEAGHKWQLCIGFHKGELIMFTRAGGAGMTDKR